MADYGTMKRQSTIATPTPTDDSHKPKDSTGKMREDFKLFCFFNIPATPEAAAVRVTRNFGYFGSYYTLFIWTVLSITVTLLPRSQVSLIFLVIMSAVGCSYIALLRVVPDSLLLHKTVERRLVLVLLAIGTMIVLILITEAAEYLFVILACTVPIILVHAVFRGRDDGFVEEEACGFGEYVPPTTTDGPKLADSV